MEKTLTVAEAALNFAQVIDRAHHLGEETTLLENGRPVARIVPAKSMAKTGKQIAVRLAALPPCMTSGEAAAFEADVQKARAEMPKPVSPWD